ncbi:trace amine-associated receptor 9-like [Orbicella faveolata]|uniref:trace amine-associated receptor 9-like n=1 Tax=Orbicella faveolata TaxID=48498 RepID=UPI0009E3D76F|nr:trace amine-associated receptor 9-like [Orbicella faveolata]
MSLILGLDPCGNATVTPPNYLSFFTASSSILITIVASVGNSLVVIAVIWNPYKDLRTPFNYFVVNLSIADLVVGLILGPLSTISHVLEGLDMLKPPFKHAVHIVYFTFCTASLLSLTAMALDRYLAIMHPLSYRTNLSPVRALLISVLLWIVSILLSMIYFIVGYDRFRFIFANTAVAVTIIDLIFTTTKILKHLRHQMQQWDDLLESSGENLIMRKLMMWEKKMTKTLLIVTLLFLTFYLPSCIFIYIIDLCTNCHCVFIHWIRDFQWLLVMTTSAVNPFVYAWRLENFRRVFRGIVTCHTCIRSMSVLNHNHYQPL